MFQPISDERGKEFERTALRMVGTYSKYVLEQMNEHIDGADYFSYSDKVVNDLEAINKHMVQLMMMKYLLRLEKNRVKFPDLEWPCLKLDISEHRLDYGTMETLQDCLDI